MLTLPVRERDDVAIDGPRPERWTVRRCAWAMGTLALLCVLATIGDPGITVDEPLDVAPGRRYVETLLARGVGFFGRATVARTFADNAEHPPLGRWLLGIASKTFEPVEVLLLGPDTFRPGLFVRSGRVAPAACFAALVGLVTFAAGRRYGRAGGLSAGFALMVMPRVFAHAHLGALDTFVALFWTWALLSAVKAADSRRPVVAMAIAGIVWGLAILTKIHGWLLPPVVLAWAWNRLPVRVLIPAMSAWAAAGLAVFFVGWPWLWYDSGARLAGYFATGLHRTPTFVRYFGVTYTDTAVPWHYPWLYALATVPPGLHVLGGIGVIQGIRERKFDPFPLLLLGTIAGFLALFSTRVPVYDGERLFLPIFPLWAILIGRGFASVWDDIAGRARLRLALVAALLAQSLGVIAIHPFGLSYYNVLVGGLPGAERLGLELTYWGDSVDGVLLDRLARVADEGDTAALAPTLAPGQGHAATSRPLFFRKSIALEDQEAAGRSEWVVVSRREAYWTPEVRAILERPPEFVRSRQGVWLSGLWRRPD